MALELADATETQMAYEQMPGASRNPFQGDEKLFVRFRLDQVKNEQKSIEAGRHIYEDLACVRVQVPGDKDNVIDEPITLDRGVLSNPGHPKNYPLRFPKQWAAFKAGQSQEATSGTPLKHWPQIGRAEAAEMAYFGIHTVEQLAGMSDSTAQRGMNWQSRKQAAQDFLSAAKDGAHLTQLRAELDKRDEQIAGLQKQHDDLVASLAGKAKK